MAAGRATDPYDARLALGLVQALVRAGDRPGALREAAATRRGSAQELGVAPDAAFQQAVAAIRARRTTDLTAPRSAGNYSDPPRRPESRMRIGVPKETAPGERRVALVPESCKKLMQAGYEVAIEAGAGDDAGLSPTPPTARRAPPSRPTAPRWSARADILLKVGPPAAGRGRLAARRARSISAR